MSLDDVIPAWANAIAQFEGYNSPGSVAARNHNPGNLKYAGQAGAIGKDPSGFAVFSSDVIGFQALYNQLTKFVSNYPNSTLLDITAHYLGQSAPTVNKQGDAFNYANYLANSLGVDPSTTLAELVSGAPPAAPIPPELQATSTPDQTTMTVMGPDGNLETLPASPASSGSILPWLLGGLALVWIVSEAWR
jgi:hypothetical protein